MFRTLTLDCFGGKVELESSLLGMIQFDTVDLCQKLERIVYVLKRHHETSSYVRGIPKRIIVDDPTSILIQFQNLRGLVEVSILPFDESTLETLEEACGEKLRRGHLIEERQAAGSPLERINSREKCEEWRKCVEKRMTEYCIRGPRKEEHGNTKLISIIVWWPEPLLDLSDKNR